MHNIKGMVICVSFLLIALSVGSQGSYINKGPLPVFAQTSSVTVGNTNVETSFISTGVGTTTLPAGFFFPGKTIKVRVLGVHSATGNPNVTVNVKLGGVTVLTSGAVASQTSTNQAFVIEGWITCRTTGVSGTVFSQGTYTETGNFAVGMANTSANTINTTSALAVDVTLQWGTTSPSDTSTATNVLIENAS